MNRLRVCTGPFAVCTCSHVDECTQNPIARCWAVNYAHLGDVTHDNMVEGNVVIVIRTHALLAGETLYRVFPQLIDKFSQSIDD